MKTTWIETKSGLYMEIIEPEPIEVSELTDSERITAAANYLASRYVKAMRRIGELVATAAESFANYSELTGIPECVEDDDLSRWENDGGAVHDPDDSD